MVFEWIEICGTKWLKYYPMDIIMKCAVWMQQ